MVKHVLILSNYRKSRAINLAKEIKEYFVSQGIEVTEDDGSDLDRKIDVSADLAITIGGDGTVLSATRRINPEIPILPVNMGSFGYITEIGADEWKNAFELFSQGKALISSRLRLNVSAYRDGECIWIDSALNEVTVAMNGRCRLIGFSMKVNGNDAGKFRSDGIIVSTPTGSTAYSLAAGGPIVEASLDAIVFNPICPFSLSNRPVVFSSDKTIEIEVENTNGANVSLAVDGQNYVELNQKSRIVISASSEKTKIVCSPIRTYTDILRDKLGWFGGRNA